MSPDRVTVISNWGDAERVSRGPRENAWAVEHGLVDKFVVMHFGNVGHAQDLDTLIRATTFLRDLDDLVVPIIGVGARLQELAELAATIEADKVGFLPWQPYEQPRAPDLGCAISTSSGSRAASPGTSSRAGSGACSQPGVR